MKKYCLFYKYSLSLMIILLPVTAFPKTVSFSWDKSSTSDLAGYKLYYGSLSRFNSSTPYNGNASPITIINYPPEGTYSIDLSTGTYFFALTAFDNDNNESDFSNELRVDIPPPVPPELLWVNDSNNFSFDGVNPDAGDTNTVFTFRVLYIDINNTPPESNILLYIDKNNNGNYLDTSEIITTTEENSFDINYTDGKVYFTTLQIPAITTNNAVTSFKYKFSASNGLSSAIGIASLDTIGPAFQDLRLLINTGNPINSSLWNSRTSIANSVKLIGPITVVNTGNGPESINISIDTEDDKYEWVHSTSPGRNMYSISALFAGQNDTITLNDFNENVNDDILSLKIKASNNTQFTCSNCTSSGVSINPDQAISLWLKINTPTSVQGKWDYFPHNITLKLDPTIVK